jgi:hypothetical protein
VRLAVIGLVRPTTRRPYSKFANPFLFVTRPEIFLIGAMIAMANRLV